jgi:glycosyltransferase involved in cell wall biosynthesis
VGSDVGMNGELIESGRNGLLARTADDWVETLASLARDVALRERLGRAGRETARAYGYSPIADRLAAFVASVASGSSAAR